jgi:hypothetical protein
LGRLIRKDWTRLRQKMAMETHCLRQLPCPRAGMANRTDGYHARLAKAAIAGRSGNQNFLSLRPREDNREQVGTQKDTGILMTVQGDPDKELTQGGIQLTISTQGRRHRLPLLRV